MLKPVKLKPIYKEKIWGGDNFNRYYSFEGIPNKCGEVWLLSCNEEGISETEDGILLSDYLKENVNSYKDELFPLTVKLIYPSDDLSIQLHPDKDISSDGKNELWYAAASIPDGEIVYNTDREYTKKELSMIIPENTEKILKKRRVSEGDSFYIPSGLVHGLGKDILVAEIQDNSNTTYRLFDYNRKDGDGKFRPLHIKESIDSYKYYTDNEISALRFSSYCNDSYTDAEILTCNRNFASLLFKSENSVSEINTDSHDFISLIFLSCENTKLIYEGGEINISPGNSIFVPGHIGVISVNGLYNMIMSFPK